MGANLWAIDRDTRETKCRLRWWLLRGQRATSLLPMPVNCDAHHCPSAFGI